ncbi:MAG: SGNH/GDSL hydrolase family protein [Elusimicrobiota bacterium]
MATPRRRRFLLRLALAAFSGFLALIGGLAARSVLALSGFGAGHRDRFTDPADRFDPELGWAPIPNYQALIESDRVTTNRLGFRSPELDDDRDKIVILGDSVAWGNGVGDEQTVSSRLQRRLSGMPLQVVNMAVSGYGPDQEYVWLRRNISSLNRRRKTKLIVLVLCAYNDLDDLANPFAEGRIKPHYRMRDGRLNAPSPVSKYGLTNLICAMGLPGAWKRKLLLALNDPASYDESELLMREFYHRIQRLAEDSGARFAVVVSPWEDNLRGRELGQYERFGRILAGQGYAVIDFKPVLGRQGDPAPFLFDGVHYSAAGNDLLAETIYRRLIPRR